MRRFAWVILSACSHGGPFRPFVAPPALVSPGPATDATQQCRDGAAVVTDYEAGRERAAFDAELRKTGGMLLVATEDRRTADGAVKLGTTVRGPSGERWLVVGETNACGEVYQTVAISAAHEVFVADPQPKALQQRIVSLCTPDCRLGCGNQHERHAVVVEVPKGAHLGAPRDVPFPIDVQVDADAFAPGGARIECEKKK
jgi:hypothetical protein